MPGVGGLEPGGPRLQLALFLGVHSVSIVAPQWRDAQAARLGENAWKGIYTLLSLAGFALIVIGYGQARQCAAEAGGRLGDNAA